MYYAFPPYNLIFVIRKEILAELMGNHSGTYDRCVMMYQQDMDQPSMRHSFCLCMISFLSHPLKCVRLIADVCM